MKIRFQFPKMKEAFEANRASLIRFVAAMFQTQRAMIFDAEGAYNGRKRWAPLKFRSGMILSRSGARGLRGSIAPRNDGIVPTRGPSTILDFAQDRFTIGTSLFYAKTHQEGAVIKPVNAEALKIPIPSGRQLSEGLKQILKSKAGARKLGVVKIDKQHFIFRKKVTIPARPFMDFTTQDGRELEDSLAGRVADILNQDERSVQKRIQGVIRVSS